MSLYTVFEIPLDKDHLSEWAEALGSYVLIKGYDCFGDLYLIRISFDGYGCCIPSKKPSCIEKVKSAELIKRFKVNEYKTPFASKVLKEYFLENSHILWKEALLDHALI